MPPLHHYYVCLYVCLPIQPLGMQPPPPPPMPAVMSSPEEDTGSEDEAAVIAPENREGEEGEWGGEVGGVRIRSGERKRGRVRGGEGEWGREGG